MDEARAHWNRALTDAEVRHKGVVIVAKRVARGLESSPLGFAQCDLAGTQRGLFMLVMRDGAPTRFGYMRNKTELYQFERRQVPGWDAAELLRFAISVVDREFSYPAEWCVTITHDDLEAKASEAVRRMKLPPG